MSKVITFSRTFPSYHPKSGQPTYFVEKVYTGLTQLGYKDHFQFAHEDWCDSEINVSPKFHTIRAGNRWKAGDRFSPRVWSGKPYNSKQIILAPDIEIKKVWELEITANFKKQSSLWVMSGQKADVNVSDIATNDGLSFVDLFDWFKIGKPEFKGFSGQIICWNENINY